MSLFAYEVTLTFEEDGREEEHEVRAESIDAAVELAKELRLAQGAAESMTRAKVSYMLTNEYLNLNK